MVLGDIVGEPEVHRIVSEVDDVQLGKMGEQKRDQAVGKGVAENEQGRGVLIFRLDLEKSGDAAHKH